MINSTENSKCLLATVQNLLQNFKQFLTSVQVAWQSDGLFFGYVVQPMSAVWNSVIFGHSHAVVNIPLAPLDNFVSHTLQICICINRQHRT